MKKRLIKALSILTVLAMLAAFLPAALSEGSEADVQETPVLSEAPVPEEEAGEEAEPAAAAEEPAPAPAAAEEPVPDDTPAEEPAPAPAAEESDPAPAQVSAAEEETAPAPAAEEPAPAPAEEEAPAPAAEEEVPAPAPAPAEEPAPVPAAEEPDPAPVPAAEEGPAPAPAAVEEPAPVPAAEEPAPATAEEEAPAPAAEEEEPIPEENKEPAEEAEEEQPAPAAGEEEPADPDTENEEPIELNVGETLSGTVFAGKALKIRLRSVNAETIHLTLTMNAGQQINVRINDRDADLTGIETGDEDKADYTCEIQAAEGACYDLALSAQTDTEFLLKAEAGMTCDAVEEPAAEPEETETAAEEPADSGEPAGEAEGDEEPENNPAADDHTEEETGEEPDETETGFVRVMVIRENGTNLYSSASQNAEAVGKLNHGDIYWIRPAGGMWGEIVLDDGNGPLYLNLNNVVLLRGEVGYDIPIRKVRLVSTLDGMTEIEEGTEITITAEFSGFMEDEIADITWQYRTENDAEDAFRNIDGVNGLVYTYSVTDENVHNEWRIVLTLNS